jgi:hypothetical protein
MIYDFCAVCLRRFNHAVESAATFVLCDLFPRLTMETIQPRSWYPKRNLPDRVNRSLGRPIHSEIRTGGIQIRAADSLAYRGVCESTGGWMLAARLSQAHERQLGREGELFLNDLTKLLSIFVSVCLCYKA